ncbi:cell adhesion molecule CEACAM5-like isoform X2 [Salvelinus alpinus]|uniref:cell adhesion molecule CEACAM5-like isoform X2 n=1 Tax=Salvelinus alpinus TaxID=8036 RepID=UPI0039FD879A
MPKLTLIRLCFWLCLARTVVSGDLYHQVEGELVLTPDKSTVPDSITSILWKHGKEKVAEWDKDFGGLDIYGAFKERTTLNQNTGELRISGLKKTDSGVYSVEFNSKLLDKTYKVSVIKAVPKPTITSSCNTNKTSCTLTCEGDTTDAEPITYSWKVGEGAWEVIGKQLIVSKSDTGKSTNSYKYICKLKNTVSVEGEVSEPVGEVFVSDLYHQVEGELVLTPDKSTVPDSIISILWKHGKEKVAEWDKDFGGLDIYGAFKERTTLDQNTGELRISGLMETDSGVYSVEFNSKLLDKTYKVSVIKAVPKPTITSSCNANKTSCTLTCEGDTTDAEPITYSWKVGEGAWEVIGKQLIVSKSDTGKSTNGYKYICKLKNTVSVEGEVSEPVGEVFVSEDFYHQVGGELVLTPDKSTVPDFIISILWKHGKEKVAEWDKDFGGLDIYGAFKERTTLNQNTGELRISGLKKTDSGVYSVEFNRKQLDKTYKVSVIKAVPKPTITSSCNTNKTSCTLTCEGNTTDAEPITYSWKVGEGAWQVIGKQLIVSKSDTGKSTNSYKYICKLKNTVSVEGEVSEPVGEVFVSGILVWKKKKELPDDTMREILSKVFCGICEATPLVE